MRPQLQTSEEIIERLLTFRGLRPAGVGAEGLLRADDIYGNPWAVVVVPEVSDELVRELFRDARGRRLLVGSLARAPSSTLAVARRLGIELLDAESLDRLGEPPPPSAPAAPTPPGPRREVARPWAAAPETPTVPVPEAPPAPEQDLARGDYEAALAGFRTAALANPGDLETRFAIADILHRLHRHEEELSEYDALARLGVDSPKIRLARGAALHRLGRFAEAVAVCDALLARLPDHAQAWNNRGAAFLALGRKEEAAASLRQALYFDPGLDEARQNLVLAGEDPKKGGRNALQPWRDGEVPSPAGWTEAAVLASLGLGKEALLVWERHPASGDGRAWFGLAAALQAYGEAGAASRALEKSLSLGDASARYTRATALADGGDRAAAHAALDGLAGPRPSVLRATLALAVDHPEEALRHLAAAATAEAGAELPWNAAGAVELRRGNYRNALEAFERALAVNPGLAVAVNNRGVALWRMGRVREAADAFEEATRLAGTAEHWLNLGIARAHGGAEKLGQRAFEAAARLAPDWPRPLVELARLRRRRGDKRGAKRLLARAVLLGWRAPTRGRGGAPRRGASAGSRSRGSRPPAGRRGRGPSRRG